MRAGALASLLAGSLSATASTPVFSHETLPVRALWYGAALLSRTLAGALSGQRLLRWCASLSVTCVWSGNRTVLSPLPGREFRQDPRGLRSANAYFGIG